MNGGLFSRKIRNHFRNGSDERGSCQRRYLFLEHVVDAAGEGGVAVAGARRGRGT